MAKFVPEDYLQGLQVPSHTLEEHNASILFARSNSFEQGNIHHGTDYVTPSLFDEDLLFPNVDASAFDVYFSLDIDSNLNTVNNGDFPGNPQVSSSYMATEPSYTVPSIGSSSMAPAALGAVHPASLNHVTTAPSSQGLNVSGRLRFTCHHPGCLKSYTRRPDMRRHALSHNAATPLHFCPHAGCPRQARGFPRKDKLQAHLKAVYGA